MGAMKLNRRELLASAVGAAGSVACQTSQRPNILFLFPDQLRWDWIETTAGMPVRTPNVAGLAQRGVLFERAWCPSPLCAPSRACLAAGVEYDQCRVAGNGADYPLDQPTFYQALEHSGYHVTGCGKFDLHKATADWGVDGKRMIAEWGFSDGIDNAGKFDAVNSGSLQPKDPYMAYLHETSLADTHVTDFAGRRGPNSFSNTEPTPLPEQAYCDNWIGQNGINLLRAAPADKPWFMQVNFAGPHSPLDVTTRMHPLYDGEDGFPLANRNTEYPADKHLQMRRNYSAMVENIDRLCGLLIDEVAARGELDNTLIIFSSDHGEMLGDHNRWSKLVPNEPSTGVPLIVAGPGIRSGIRTAAPASVMDIAATCLDAARLPVPSEMDSRSLMPLLSGSAESHREYLFSGLEPWRAVTDGQYKLIRGFDPSITHYYPEATRPVYATTKGQPPLLFDLAADPQENRNIADSAPGIVRRLDEALAS